jgi:outer membrane protein assembly factor BamE (lipoprotein component of BamABCDE complex)
MRPVGLRAWESRMRFKSARLLIGLAAGAAAIGIGGCTPLRSHQGYVIDTDLVNSVQPGVDNRQSVLDTLGTPTFTSQFGKGEWFYVARDSRNFSYNKPKAASQITLKVSFDDKGTVTRIDRTGVDQVAQINPDKKTTPTLGRTHSFFQELFGNIGTVGAPGMAPPDQGGGGRDTP